MVSPLACAAPLVLVVGALPQAPVSAPPPGTLTLPAFTGYAHPDPERVDREKDGTVKRCDGELVFYVRLAHAGELHVDLETNDCFVFHFCHREHGGVTEFHRASISESLFIAQYGPVRNLVSASRNRYCASPFSEQEFDTWMWHCKHGRRS